MSGGRLSVRRFPSRAAEAGGPRRGGRRERWPEAPRAAEGGGPSGTNESRIAIFLLIWVMMISDPVLPWEFVVSWGMP